MGEGGDENDKRKGLISTVKRVNLFDIQLSLIHI